MTTIGEMSRADLGAFVQEQPIDLDEVERWSKGEGKLDLFKQIRTKLE